MCDIILYEIKKGAIYMELMAIIGTIVIMLGVILIYDARQITRKVFSFSDQNVATLALKVLGFFTSTIGGLLIIF